MAIDPYLPLGEPVRNDVDAAARLLVDYLRSGAIVGIEHEFHEQFFMLVDDPDAVFARAKEMTNV
jgi:hypothetical protein